VPLSDILAKTDLESPELAQYICSGVKNTTTAVHPTLKAKLSLLVSVSSLVVDFVSSAIFFKIF
jgi:hypothetical protein